MKLLWKMSLALGLLLAMLSLLDMAFAGTDVAKTTWLIVGCTLICVSFFIAGRVKKGASVQQPAEQEKSESRKAQDQITLRNLLARLLGMFGALFIVAALGSRLYGGDSTKLKFGMVVFIATFGLFLLACAAFLLKTPELGNKHPLWFPAVSGFACSCCVVIFVAGMILKSQLPKSKSLDPSDYMLFGSALGGAVSALVCIATALGVLIGPKKNSEQLTGEIS